MGLQNFSMDKKESRSPFLEFYLLMIIILVFAIGGFFYIQQAMVKVEQQAHLFNAKSLVKYVDWEFMFHGTFSEVVNQIGYTDYTIEQLVEKEIIDDGIGQSSFSSLRAITDLYTADSYVRVLSYKGKVYYQLQLCDKREATVCSGNNELINTVTPLTEEALHLSKTVHELKRADIPIQKRNWLLDRW